MAEGTEVSESAYMAGRRKLRALKAKQDEAPPTVSKKKAKKKVSKKSS